MAALNLKSLAAYLGTAEASAALASTVVDAADAADDAGPLVVFYTNCQGRGLAPRRHRRIALPRRSRSTAGGGVVEGSPSDRAQSGL